MLRKFEEEEACQSWRRIDQRGMTLQDPSLSTAGTRQLEAMADS